MRWPARGSEGEQRVPMLGKLFKIERKRKKEAIRDEWEVAWG